MGTLVAAWRRAGGERVCTLGSGNGRSGNLRTDCSRDKQAPFSCSAGCFHISVWLYLVYNCVATTYCIESLAGVEVGGMGWGGGGESPRLLEQQALCVPCWIQWSIRRHHPIATVGVGGGHPVSAPEQQTLQTTS